MTAALITLTAVAALLATLVAVVIHNATQERQELLEQLRHANNLIATRTPTEAAKLERAQTAKPQPTPTPTNNEPVVANLDGPRWM